MFHCFCHAVLFLKDFFIVLLFVTDNQYIWVLINFNRYLGKKEILSKSKLFWLVFLLILGIWLVWLYFIFIYLTLFLKNLSQFSHFTLILSKINIEKKHVARYFVKKTPWQMIDRALNTPLLAFFCKLFEILKVSISKYPNGGIT